MTVRLPVAIALTLALPVCLASLGILSIAAGERAGGAPFAGIVPRNSAEAAGLGEAAELLRFLRSGNDPRRVYPVRAEILSSAIRNATTIEAAVWSRQLELVKLLEREGAIATAGEKQALACLAADLGVDDIAEYLDPGKAQACEPSHALARVAARTTTAGGAE